MRTSLTMVHMPGRVHSTPASSNKSFKTSRRLEVTGQPVVLKLQPRATEPTTLVLKLFPQLTKHTAVFF